MRTHSHSPKSVCRNRRGIAFIYLIISMAVFMGFTALAVDWGQATVVKSQLQMMADAAAIYAAESSSSSTAFAYAQASVSDNPVNGVAVTLNNSDVQTGNWSGGTFTANGTPFNAVKVSLHYTKARGLGVKATFGQIIGMSAMDCNASATSTVGTPQNFGIVGISYVKMSGGTSDSYNSSVSTLGWSSSPTYEGTIESNGNISLSGSASIQGNAMAGIGGSVSASGGSLVHGTTGNLTTALSYPNATAGSATTSNNNSNISASYYSSSTRNLTINGGATYTLSGGTYYLNSLTLSGGSILNFSGPVTIYCTGTVDISGGSISTSGNVPANFNLDVIGTGKVTVSGSSALYANIYCPQSDFTLSGSGILGGAVVAGAIDQSGSGSIYYDQSLQTQQAYPELVQ